MTTTMAAGWVAPQVFNLGAGLWHSIEMMTATFVINGVLHAMAYLKDSPLPPDPWDQVTERREGRGR